MSEAWTPAAGAMTDEQARTWVIATHISGLVLFLGIPSVIGPLVVWLLQRNSHPLIDAHGKQAINFHLSMLIYLAISAVLALIIIGIVGIVVFGLITIIATILAAVRAANGEPFTYPFSIRFLN